MKTFIDQVTGAALLFIVLCVGFYYFKPQVVILYSRDVIIDQSRSALRSSP